MPPLLIRALLPLIKGDRMDTAIEKLVEVGVDAIVVWPAARSVARVDGARRDARLAKYRAAAAVKFLRPPQPRPLAGKRVLITAGPTHEPIDPVRYIANRSSGKQGFALAAAALAAGADVTLVSGPVDLDDPAGVP